ncbi:MAG: cytochrome c oxidase subunit 2A [Bacillaceae bacterium]
MGMKAELNTRKKHVPTKKVHNEFLWGTFIAVLGVGAIIVAMWVLMWDLWLSR